MKLDPQAELDDDPQPLVIEREPIEPTGTFRVVLLSDEDPWWPTAFKLIYDEDQPAGA